MLNFMMGCLYRLQENWDLKKWGFFQRDVLPFFSKWRGEIFQTWPFVNQEEHRPSIAKRAEREKLSIAIKINKFLRIHSNQLLFGIYAPTLRKFELLILFFLVKSCLFLKTDMDNSPSNFACSTVQCLAIEWYLCICMSNGSANTTKKP
jgi:hypothetical protein